MAWATLLVLACLSGLGPEGRAEVGEASKRSGEREGSVEAQGRSEGAREASPVPQAPAAGSREASRAPGASGEASPAPGGSDEGGWDDAPSSAAPAMPILDPWASVPVQTALPPRTGVMPPFARPDRSRSVSAPLLDPWAGAARRHVPRHLDPELRDPFRGKQPRHAGPRIARADLRDPFARRSGSPGASRPAAVAEPAARSEAGLPPHPDLRDPFGHRKARPAPPAREAAPAPAPRAPAVPPSGAAPRPSSRSGALQPAPWPFAHLPRARRPA